jgi:thymidylate synthase ThyX
MAQEKSDFDKVNTYVSNTDRDIYTVSNIPEEVVAVIFAYVSRSPKGFRENIDTVIQEEQLGQERAAKFHEKWVLNYGHASVAEHAALHVGVERVSRLFSSVLELSNEYLSFTEYSQRYQKPVKGDFFLPEELKDKSSLKKEYVELNNYLYDTYSGLNNTLFEYLKDTVPPPEHTEERIHFRALEKVAFEDARYALSLATFTNLGLTANARALEDSLSKLLSSKYSEVRNRAGEIKEEVRFSVPTLVKYANENEYIIETRRELEAASSTVNENYIANNSAEGSSVKLLDWTGKGASDPEEKALDKMVNAILFEHSDLSYEAIENRPLYNDAKGKFGILQKSIEKLGKFDNPINAFKLVQYSAEFVISEACWHQLLRHRKTDWIYKEPGVSDGITMPPNVESAGIVNELRAAVKESENIYHKFIQQGLPLVASYTVTNAHNRRIIGSFDLWELFHLVNLRMSEGAQWDIKNVTHTLADEIGRHHPKLIAPALGRIE